MSALVLTTYDLGRPPADLVGWLNGQRLRTAVTFTDLAVRAWPGELVARASAVVVVADMHTAAVLGSAAAERIRCERPGVEVALFGLVAGMQGAGEGFDAVFGPEQHDALVEWMATRAPKPLREPPGEELSVGSLQKYARLSIHGEERLAGAVAASSGCLHRCRHCPVPVAFGGRIRLQPVERVIDVVDAQVVLGAQHVSFTDPDFLNAPGHARRVIAALRARHPHLSWDATVKVEHILRHRSVWAEFASQGCLFVTSAFESADDDTLDVLDKGHTVDEAAAAVHVLRSVGIEVRPTWLPFFPFTTPAHVAALFDFVAAHDLVASIDPVQYSIRLLVPGGSLLAKHSRIKPHLRAYDPVRHQFAWYAVNPAVDVLQEELSVLAESGLGQDVTETFERMRVLVDGACGRELVEAGARGIAVGSVEGRPRMTEPWFC